MVSGVVIRMGFLCLMVGFEMVTYVKQSDVMRSRINAIGDIWSFWKGFRELISFIAPSTCALHAFLPESMSSRLMKRSMTVTMRLISVDGRFSRAVLRRWIDFCFADRASRVALAEESVEYLVWIGVFTAE